MGMPLVVFETRVTLEYDYASRWYAGCVDSNGMIRLKKYAKNGKETVGLRNTRKQMPAEEFYELLETGKLRIIESLHEPTSIQRAFDDPHIEYAWLHEYGDSTRDAFYGESPYYELLVKLKDVDPVFKVAIVNETILYVATERFEVWDMTDQQKSKLYDAVHTYKPLQLELLLY
jgi:hypothetical protein